MRNITEYIIESSEFSNTSMAQEILDDKHIEYKLDKNPNNNYIRIDNSNISVSIRIKNKTLKRVSGALYTSSRADDADIVLQILDSFDNYKNNKKLFNKLKKLNYKEANNWRCAQWGTWKFVISSWDELEEIADIISEL